AMLARSKRTQATLVAQKDFAFVCREIPDKIDDRLTAYEQILRSAMAFIEHSEGVTRQEWQHFVTEQQLEHQLPGIQGLGFALLIPRSELAQHIQTIRAEGFPDYQVHPVGDREIYSSIIYLEPFTNLNLRAFGYDMFSEQVRRTAMERARDENRAALSGKVILVQETGQNIQAGTLMYLPVFHKKMPTATVDQRRAAIYGWVYSPFRMSDLMRGILRGRDLTGTRHSIRLEVFAGDLITPTALLYNSQPGENSLPIPAERLTLQRRLVIAGEHWTLRFTQTDSALADDQSWIIWLSGITTSLLLAGIFLSLLNTRYKALLAAHRLSTALQASTDKYRHLVENLPTGVLVFNIDATLLLANPLAVRLFGRSEDQLRKLTATASEWDFLREDATALSPAEYPFNQVLTTGQAITDRVIGIRQPNRTDNIWMLCSTYPQPTPSGQLSQVIVCFNNITARKLAEEQLYNSNRRLVTTLTTLRQTCTRSYPPLPYTACHCRRYL
ncbi:MAG: CHASE domain-containing protein, partial [Phycisphaerae bacterium]